MENDLVTLFMQGFVSGLGLYASVWFLSFCIGKIVATFEAASK